MVWTKKMESKNSVTEQTCHCDFCKKDLTGQDRYDFATRTGPWSVGCKDCFEKHGIKLGIGWGQRFDAKGRCLEGNRTVGGFRR